MNNVKINYNTSWLYCAYVLSEIMNYYSTSLTIQLHQLDIVSHSVSRIWIHSVYKLYLFKHNGKKDITAKRRNHHKRKERSLSPKPDSYIDTSIKTQNMIAEIDANNTESEKVKRPDKFDLNSDLQDLLKYCTNVTKMKSSS